MVKLRIPDDWEIVERINDHPWILIPVCFFILIVAVMQFVVTAIFIISGGLLTEMTRMENLGQSCSLDGVSLSCQIIDALVRAFS